MITIWFSPSLHGYPKRYTNIKKIVVVLLTDSKKSTYSIYVVTLKEAMVVSGFRIPILI